MKINLYKSITVAAAASFLCNCSWSGPSPAGYYAAIYETGIEDVGPQA